MSPFFKLLLSLLFFSAGVLFFPVNVALVLVVVLYEKFIATPDERRWGRVIPFVVVGLVGLYLHRGVLTLASLDPSGMFAPLYLVFYPLGLLPETAGRCHTYPVLGWLSAFVIVCMLALIHRKARHPAFLFGVLGAFAVRLFQGTHEIDLVHMVGGGQLLVAIALLNIAFAALCLRVMRHPKWHRPVVFLTTLLCLVLFALQVRANLAWRYAGREVQAFQRVAEQAAAARPDTLLGVLPDFQYYRGAPMMLSESIRHDTLFSPALEAVPVLPIHLDSAKTLKLGVRSWSASEATVGIAAPPLDVLCSPYVLPEPSGAVETKHVVVHWEEVQDNSAILRIRPKHGTLPEAWIPFRAAGPGAVPLPGMASAVAKP